MSRVCWRSPFKSRSRSRKCRSSRRRSATHHAAPAFSVASTARVRIRKAAAAGPTSQFPVLAPGPLPVLPAKEVSAAKVRANWLRGARGSERPDPVTLGNSYRTLVWYWRGPRGRAPRRSPNRSCAEGRLGPVAGARHLKQMDHFLSASEAASAAAPGTDPATATAGRL